MGIWDAKEDAAYLRRATEQRLVGDRYILKVVRSNIAEVIGNQDVTLNTRIYFNRNASATRSGGMEMPGAKYIDGQKIQLAQLPGIATTFIIYGVPVYINFDTSVFLKLNATLDGNAKAGFNYKFNTEFKAGCKYDNRWSLIKSGSINKNKLDFINPAADVEAKAGVGLMLGVDVIIDKLAGPSLAVGPQVTAEAKWTYKTEDGEDKCDIKASAKAGFAGEVGAKIKIWGYTLKDWHSSFDLGPQTTIAEYPEKK